MASAEVMPCYRQQNKYAEISKVILKDFVEFSSISLQNPIKLEKNVSSLYHL